MIKKLRLTEAIDDEELEDLENQEIENDIADEEQEQEENPNEEESLLDKQLDELRDILVDLDLNLYQIINKEDTNNVVYVVGKVAEDSDDVLMLVDTKADEKEEVEEEPVAEVIDDEEITEDIDATDTNVGNINTEDEEDEDRWKFVTLPKSFEEINKYSPRYGDELTPKHEDLVEYLMNCLIEVNPEAYEELQAKDNEEENIETMNLEELPLGNEEVEEDYE